MENEEIKVTDRKTFVSMGLLAILISAATSIALYVSSIDGKANENRLRITDLEQKRFDIDRRIFDQLNEIRKELYLIKGHLEAQKSSKK